MIIVSTRDFRQNQTRYLSMAQHGENVVLRSRTGNFVISPLKDDDTLVSKRDLTAELLQALQEVKDHLDGKIKLKTAEQLIDELRDNNN